MRARLIYLTRLVCLVGVVLSGIAVVGCKKKDQQTHGGAVEEKSPKTPPRKVGTTEAPPRKRPVTIKDKLMKFAPTKLDFNDKLLDATNKKVVVKLIEAARVMDELFMIQSHPDNPMNRKKLAADPKSKDALAYFDIMYGVWDRLEHNKPFAGRKAKPKGAGFYPPDMTKEEFKKHLKANPKDKKTFESYFTVIRREKGKLKAVPYSVFYKKYLDRAAKALNEAAALTKDKRLARYLKLRAKAFATNNYRDSDMAWMDLGDGKLEVVIGPYEVYEDGLFGYKAAFEAFICVRDKKYSERLQKIAKYKTDMEKALPIEDKHKNFKRGSALPITVVEEIFTAGDTKAGVQTLAFNLPNDEVVRKRKGYKLVLLKNVAEAKFNKILLPIARRLMDTEQLKLVNFDAFFTNTLMHEAAHGQGPGIITVTREGKKVKTEVNKALKELYSTIEEAKADITGLNLTELMIKKGVLPKALSRRVFASYLAGFFRSVRFGGEAHGRANLISFNYLVEKKGILYDKPSGKYRINFKLIRTAVRALCRDLLMLEALGDYEGAKKFIEKYGKMSPTMKAALSRLAGIPVDIRPHYTVIQKMKAW